MILDGPEVPAKRRFCKVRFVQEREEHVYRCVLCARSCWASTQVPRNHHVRSCRRVACLTLKAEEAALRKTGFGEGSEARTLAHGRPTSRDVPFLCDHHAAAALAGHTQRRATRTRDLRAGISPSGHSCLRVVLSDFVAWGSGSASHSSPASSRPGPCRRNPTGLEGHAHACVHCSRAVEATRVPVRRRAAETWGAGVQWSRAQPRRRRHPYRWCQRGQTQTAL